MSVAAKRSPRPAGPVAARILVIEDSEPVRDLIVLTLQHYGFSADAAGDGAAGIELAKANLPDLILSDIMMPGKDGYTVLSALRSDPRTASIPVIFLTAKTSREERRRGMNLGADDYLTKPFSVAELVAAVRARLVHHKSQGELRHLNALLQEKILELAAVRRRLGTTFAAVAQELNAPILRVLGGLRYALADLPGDTDLARVLSATLQDARRCASLVTVLLQEPQSGDAGARRIADVSTATGDELAPHFGRENGRWEKQF